MEEPRGKHAHIVYALPIEKLSRCSWSGAPTKKAFRLRTLPTRTSVMVPRVAQAQLSHDNGTFHGNSAQNGSVRQ